MLRPLAALAAVVIATAGLAGCAARDPAPEPAPTRDGQLQVVASTNVYADLADLVGGEHVDVTTLLDDTAPESLAGADVVVITGADTDADVIDLLERSGNTGAVVIEAVELTGLDPLADGFDPHLWYRPGYMRSVTIRLAHTFAELDPELDFSYSTKLEIAQHWIGLLERNAATVEDTTAGMAALVTSPAPGYLLDTLGITDVTPPPFGAAGTDGGEVPPEALQSALDLLAGGTVSLVFADPQATDPATEAVRAAATQHGIPVIETAETIPDGTEPIDADMPSLYLAWQVDILRQIRVAAAI